MRCQVILKFNQDLTREDGATSRQIESIPLDTMEQAKETARKGKVLYGADDCEIIELEEDEPKHCYNCRFYNGAQSICDWNYRAKAILDERRSGKNCDLFEAGEFVDSDENLLVRTKTT